MHDWVDITQFSGLNQYIAVERSVCEALWTQQAYQLFQVQYRLPDLFSMVLPIPTLYLALKDTYEVWRLIQPCEKGGGSFLRMGKVKKAHRDHYQFPIKLEEKTSKLNTYIEFLDVRKREDMWTRLDLAPDAPDIEYLS